MPIDRTSGVGKGVAQQVKCLPHLRRQPGPHYAQLNLPRLAQKQCRAQALLQQLDLVADGGLGHAQFLGSPGEAEMTCDGLKGTDGRERWQGHG
ncbi:hypothetical protein D3C87_1543840 [compost metagenome]